jgi:hypothetical protein
MIDKETILRLQVSIPMIQSVLAIEIREVRKMGEETRNRKRAAGYQNHQISSSTIFKCDRKQERIDGAYVGRRTKIYVG